MLPTSLGASTTESQAYCKSKDLANRGGNDSPELFDVLFDRFMGANKTEVVFK